MRTSRGATNAANPWISTFAKSADSDMQNLHPSIYIYGLE